MNVSGPAIPSAARPFFACQSLRAFSVAGPKTASASTPSLACSLFTGSPARPFMRIAMAAPPRGELLARHFCLQKADDQGREATADSSSQERRDDGANVEPGSSSRATDAEDRVQNLAADTTAERAGNGVAERAEVDILRDVSNGIATKCAGNELYDECCKVHSGLQRSPVPVAYHQSRRGRASLTM